MSIQAIIDGRDVGHTTILAWEDRRTVAVGKKLGISFESGSRDGRKRELLQQKLSLGHDRLQSLLRSQLWWSEHTTRLGHALSGGKRNLSVCELVISKGSAEGFARWFADRNTLDDEPAMLAACPDHYIITRDEAGRQLVVETTGGAPLPAMFTVDYDDVSSLATQADPTYPLQVAGVARLGDGLAVGGVRHQFRQEGDGFRALLTVEFPRATPTHMVAGHRWHLAVEFSNWIEAAAIAQ